MDGGEISLDEPAVGSAVKFNKCKGLLLSRGLVLQMKRDRWGNSPMQKEQQETDRMREREREGERERRMHRDTKRQRHEETETERERGRETHRQRDVHTPLASLAQHGTRPRLQPNKTDSGPREISLP